VCSTERFHSANKPIDQCHRGSVARVVVIVFYFQDARCIRVRHANVTRQWSWPMLNILGGRFAEGV
jgi:hypothetical protein